MSATTRILAVALGLLGLGAPVVAHHAFSSEYDENKVVTFKGTTQFNCSAIG